jgi:hypothetical protein
MMDNNNAHQSSCIMSTPPTSHADQVVSVGVFGSMSLGPGRQGGMTLWCGLIHLYPKPSNISYLYI